LNRTERIAVLIFVGALVVVDIVGFFDPTLDPWLQVLSIATTAAFALYIWSPLLATIAVGAALVLSFFTESATAGLTAGAVAAGLVLRLGATPLIFGYAGGFLLSNAAFVYFFGGRDGTTTNVAVALVISIVAGGVGLALRLGHARGQRLARQLAESAERERQAIMAERRWIAGELHDSIAHHLTVVAMHVQLIDDDGARPTSQAAIQVAARKAMSDLRFVIQLAEDAPRGTGVPSGDLAAAIDEATEEFEAAGHQVECEGDPRDESIPRGAEIILARIVRESATNVLKYAGPGMIRFALVPQADAITLTIESPLPDTPRRDLPSTGTGLNRMAERVLGVSGSFTAGPRDGVWCVEVRLPLADEPDRALSA